MDQESFRRDRILIHLEYLTIDFNLLDNKKKLSILVSMVS